MEREGAKLPAVEAVLPDGSIVEIDETLDFTARIDKLEDRKNDGNRYKGLLSKDDYDKRKKQLNEKLRRVEEMCLSPCANLGVIT